MSLSNRVNSAPSSWLNLMRNVNQPGRWRRPELTKDLKESDVDWVRYQLNRPKWLLTRGNTWNTVYFGLIRRVSPANG